MVPSYYEPTELITTNGLIDRESLVMDCHDVEIINSGLLTLQTDGEEERTSTMGPGTLTFIECGGGGGGYTPTQPYSFKVREPETCGDLDFIQEPTLDSLREILAQK